MVTRTSFEKVWILIWESLPSENLNALWICEVERAMEDVLTVQSNEPVLIKKKNWKGTGKDRVTTFWTKKFTCLYDKIAKAITVMINENIHCPEWLPGGRTVMIPKSKNPTAVSEFRLITCLNTIYKLITSVINARILEHFCQNNILQLDQRGGVKGSMGCIDNLLTDKTVLEDASKFKKNLSCVWINTKKAFDSVSHRWLIQVHRINSRIISLIESIMRAWKMTLEVITDQGPTHIGAVDVNRGIRQGDSFCVQLFTMCLNPTA